MFEFLVSRPGTISQVQTLGVLTSAVRGLNLEVREIAGYTWLCHFRKSGVEVEVVFYISPDGSFGLLHGVKVYGPVRLSSELLRDFILEVLHALITEEQRATREEAIRTSLLTRYGVSSVVTTTEEGELEVRLSVQSLALLGIYVEQEGTTPSLWEHLRT